MAASEFLVTSRRARFVLAWLFAAAMLGGYLALPADDEPEAADRNEASSEPGEAREIEIVGVAPSAPSPNTALIVRYTGTAPDAHAKVLLGKRELHVLARRPGSVVAQLPADTAIGRAKLRVIVDRERSKPYALRVKPVNWHSPFRNLVGGSALLLLGISFLSRGTRGITAWHGARALARIASMRLLVLAGGSAIGAAMQSTMAAAGVLAGLVGAGVLAVLPAAAAFLGAQLGAAITPLLFAGLVEPREGLLAVAVGVLWLCLASDRRSAAFAQLWLGAGLALFGLQVLRPDLEPFLASPELLQFAGRLDGASILGRLGAALVGAALVAVFQGPAPVLVLLLFLAEATGRDDLRGMLALLSGASLGAALGALLTTPAGRRCRRLAELNLFAALVASAIAIASVDLFAAFAERFAEGSSHEVRWGKYVLLPGAGFRLAVAFALSQVFATLATLGLLPSIERVLDRLRPEAEGTRVGSAGALSFLRTDLERTLQMQERALDPIAELALRGSREAGRSAEHALADAQQLLLQVLWEEFPPIPAEQSRTLGRVALAMLQLQRALENLLRSAEHMTDVRIAAARGRTDASELTDEDMTVMREVHVLLSTGLASLRRAFDTRHGPELEDAYEREIRMNQLEARARNALLAKQATATVRDRLAVLELVDGYEAVGNQIFRVTEVLAGTHSLTDAQVAIPA